MMSFPRSQFRIRSVFNLNVLNALSHDVWQTFFPLCTLLHTKRLLQRQMSCEYCHIQTETPSNHTFNRDKQRNIGFFFRIEKNLQLTQNRKVQNHQNQSYSSVSNDLRGSKIENNV